MRLQYDASTGEFDIALTAAGGLDSGVGNGGILESAIWSSLFSDGLADVADITPDLGDDRRGWWGDSGRAPSDSLARSLLWLYRRAKRNEATRLAIENTARDSLQWLVDDGVVSSIDVAVTFLPDPLEGVRIVVTSYEPSGIRRDWTTDLIWSGIAS
jgi:phage gp46-like protein